MGQDRTALAPYHSFHFGKSVGAPKAGISTLGEIRSADGQLCWKNDMFILDTPRSQGFVGFSRGEKIKAQSVEFSSTTPFAHVLATSLDDAPLSGSKHILLTATARVENTGQVFKAFKKGLKTIGNGPILCEPVNATLTLSRH